MADAQGLPPGCRMAVVAGAVVPRGGREALFVPQTHGRMRGRGLATGFVDTGEAPHDAAVREVREEAGVGARPVGLLALCTLAWSTGPALYAVFLCEHIAGEPVPDGSENDAARYLSPEALRALPDPVEPLSALLARRAAAGARATLLPTDIQQLDPTYRLAFMV